MSITNALCSYLLLNKIIIQCVVLLQFSYKVEPLMVSSLAFLSLFIFFRVKMIINTMLSSYSIM